MLISKTRMLVLVKDLQWKEVSSCLAGNPALLSFRDERGRNWLHLCCGVKVRERKLREQDSIKTAGVLLDSGMDINEAAFREGDWKATALWYAIAHGQNVRLAEYLLKRGSEPHHCMWAAAYNNDAASIRLLAKAGAEIDGCMEDSSPFLFAIQWSRFEAAEQLLKLGANVNFQNSKQMTALHCLLKKGSDCKYVRMLIRYGAHGDVKDSRGITPSEIMARKKDPEFRKIAAQMQ